MLQNIEAIISNLNGSMVFKGNRVMDNQEEKPNRKGDRFSISLRKRLHIVTVTIFKEYLIVTVKIPYKYTWEV